MTRAFAVGPDRLAGQVPRPTAALVVLCFLARLRLHVAGSVRVLTCSVLDLQYRRVPVVARSAGVIVDPTGDTVVMAFTAPDVDPIVGDWKTASWEADATTTPTTYFARCLVGPNGTIALAAGTYDIYVKVTDSPEIPVMKAGNLQVV